MVDWFTDSLNSQWVNQNQWLGLWVWLTRIDSVTVSDLLDSNNCSTSFNFKFNKTFNTTNTESETQTKQINLKAQVQLNTTVNWLLYDYSLHYSLQSTDDRTHDTHPGE